MLWVTPITVGVGNKENPFPAMRGADCGRGKHFPLRIIPDRGHILQDCLNPCGEKPRHVFNDDISRPNFFNESRVFMPQPAPFSRDALPFPRCRQAHVLAREAPAQYIDRGQVRPPQLPDILNIWGCPDTFYRKVITLEDAITGGCDLFDLESLKLEYSADEFRNLFLCEFVDDTQSVFRLADLETCYADTDAWPDFNPTADRPLGNLPVWGGYDPSRSRDDASFVIVAPPLKEGGEYRVVARYKWLDKSYIWQAERIRELVGRYNFRHIGVDVTGPGIGVFEQIRAFFPLATPINYSVQLKTQLVLKAKELIEAHRLKWDAGQNDIAHAFLTIRQGVTDSGQISYSASRTSATGHADVAWAIMHALAAEPIGKPKGGCVVFIQ